MLIEDLERHLTDVKRQHVAEIIALQALCWAHVRGFTLDSARLGAIVADVMARQSIEQAQRYEAMSWEDAIAETTRDLCTQIHRLSPDTVCLPDPHRVLQ